MRATASAAICAANGVDFFEPLNPRLPAEAPRSDECIRYVADVTIRRFDWEVRYDAEEYIRLLDTFSTNLAMERWQRDRLYGEIRTRLAARPDGLVRRHWGAVLHVARKAAHPDIRVP